MSKNRLSIYCLLLILILIGSIISGCEKTPEESQKADIDGDKSIGQMDGVEEAALKTSFWGFDEGPPEDWEYSPSWTFENGAASISEPGQMLRPHDSGLDFNLETRIKLEEDTIFGIIFRFSEKGSNQIIIEPGAAGLISEIDGVTSLLIENPTNLNPGWHEFHLMVRQNNITVFSDGKIILESSDMAVSEPGNIAFTKHSTANFSIDFVEIQPTLGESTADQESIEEERLEEDFVADNTEKSTVVQEPPVAERITYENIGDDFRVMVIGQPGAVRPNALVGIANLETTRVYFADADENGAFQREITAHPGASIQIKHTFLEFTEEEPREMVLNENSTNQMVYEFINATTGTIVRLPNQEVSDNESIPFAVSGSDEGTQGVFWGFQGHITPINTQPDQFQMRITGTFTLTANKLTEKINPESFSYLVRFELLPHFNNEGQQLALRKYLISDFLSPTRFPIFRGDFTWSPFEVIQNINDWQIRSDNTFESDVDITLTNNEFFPIEAGIYVIRMEALPTEETSAIPPDGPYMRTGQMYGLGGIYLPMIQLGEPEDPHLYWTLLTDTYHEATRGTSAREDREHVDLLAMMSFQNEKFIIRRENPKTGQPLSYRLEPFLPLIAYGDRGIPNPPTIDFAFPSGELTVVVTKPDGSQDILGPAPFVQSRNATPAFDFGRIRDYNIGGGGLQDVYQLTTMDERFDYKFDQYGHYEIEMTGNIEDVSGNTYAGGGTYDLWVAQPLKLSSGVFPASPFIEGDAFTPALQIYPRVPGEVELQLTFLPDSSLEIAEYMTYTGRANHYGYFFPQDQAPYVFESGGEYRLDIQVQYWDEQETLWMGSASWGNVVENIDTPLIAHGERGVDSGEANDLWFFNKQLGLEGEFHTLYPYYSGDVFWGQDIDNSAIASGADAIKPAITIEDTSGEIYNLLRKYYSARITNPFYWSPEFLENAIEIDQVYPLSTTSTGWDLSWAIDKIDQYGYVYQASQRPGARVHESLSESSNAISYWRFNGTYGDQVGLDGDLPNDLKWEFGGAVVRDLNQGLAEYAAYASLWVLLPDDDPMGARVTPPFQGATGGPNGGPLLTLKGEEIDLLFLPKSGIPGQILEVGETLSISGYVGPPLESKITIVITSPSGKNYQIAGQANKVGYFYQPESDLIVDEPGVWEVSIEVLHDGMTSSGPTVPPYPKGGVMGADQDRYQIFVVNPGTLGPKITQPARGFLTISETPIPPIVFEGNLPEAFQNAAYTYTISMPGFILEQGIGSSDGNKFSLTYDPAKLHQDFPNLDLAAYDELRPGLADQVWISALFTKDGQFLPLTITLHGEEVFHR